MYHSKPINRDEENTKQQEENHTLRRVNRRLRLRLEALQKENYRLSATVRIDQGSPAGTWVKD